MKQGILITAYKNFEHLIDIVKSFDENFEIYIHIDKKNYPNSELIDMLNSLKNIKFLSNKYNVNWGGLNQLKSTLFLAKEALKNEKLEYIHFISGQDYPIKTCSYFLDFINTNKGIDFLDYFEMPAKCLPNGGMDRIEYYNLYDIFNTKKSHKWIDRFFRIQLILNIKRSLSKEIPQLYGGSAWWSLTRETLKYVIDYTEQKDYLINRLKYTFCPDEIYFQTVIMNSDYSSKVINDNLRYIDWNSRNGNNPSNLDMSDLDLINSSNKLFARKFEFPISKEIKIMLGSIKK